MRRITLYVLTSLVTFSIGTGISSLLQPTPPTNTPPVVTPPPPIANDGVFEFSYIAHGCGGAGVRQLYITTEGHKIKEGTSCRKNEYLIQIEWFNLLASASQIVERVPEYKNGKSGERIVARFPPDEFTGESTRILWYDGGTCYHYLSAPTLDIALKFERTTRHTD